MGLLNTEQCELDKFNNASHLMKNMTLHNKSEPSK